LYRKRFLWRFSFIRFLRLCLAIFVLRLFLREPMRNKLKGDLRGVGEKQESAAGAMLNRKILRINPRKTIPQPHSRLSTQACSTGTQ
jgi:hypothetical protein